VLIGVAMLVALASVPLAGGRLGELAEVRLGQRWTILAALTIQILITTILPEGSASLRAGLHLGTYALAGVFVAANRRLPGMWLIALGAGLNLLVIAANGGVMPADPAAMERAGLPIVSGEFENSTALADPRLPFLGDVFAVPAWLPFANVFSIGDVVLLVGGLLALHCLCGSRLVPKALRSTAVSSPGSSLEPSDNP
jgi:hypothetical protein